MEVILAKSAGFCFGVKRAVESAFQAAEEGKKNGFPVYSFGPIIHNENVTKELTDAGVGMVESEEELRELPKGSRVIIRSHGVPKSVYRILEEANLTAADATCPFVANIHKIVSTAEEDAVVLLIGNPGHAEVEGTLGWCMCEAYVIDSEEDIASLPLFSNRKILVVGQTTYSLKKFQYLVELLKQKYYNIDVYRTICNATETRQDETASLAKKVDAMIVIGGRHSSNTQKLFDISKQHCRNTYYIQTLDDLDFTGLESVSRVGITAGASTPNYIIKEVLDRMSELSFEEMLQEETPVSIRPGQIVEGKVIGVKPDELVVDIHYKSDGVVTANEYSNTPVDLTTVVKEGDPITVKVIKTNDGDGQVLLSYKRIASEKAYEELEEAFNNKTVLKGTVRQVLSGGLSVSVSECRVFIPASLVSDTYEKDLEKFMNQEIEFVLTEFNPHKRRIIGNRKQLIIEQKREAAKELFDRIKVGDVVEGTVKNVTDFGAFIDLGGADGLLHISEMSWGRVENPKKMFKVGDSVKAFIKNINGEKIALSLKFDDKNPWIDADKKYAIGTVVKGRVARMTDFGAFIVLEPGIDALLHVSQIALDHVEKPSDVLKTGQEIEAKVVDLKLADKKISLSIKALLKDQKNDDAEAASAAEEAPAEEAPVEETAEAPATEAPVEEAAPAEDAPAEEAEAAEEAPAEE